MTGRQRLRHGVGAFGFHAPDSALRLQRFHGGGYAAYKPATADTDEHVGSVGQIFNYFQTNRSLSRHHQRIVERVNGSPAFTLIGSDSLKSLGGVWNQN